MRPIVLRDGEPVEIEPLSPGGRVDFGEPIGEADTIYTLHSELRTFRESFGCAEGSFRLSLSAGGAGARARADRRAARGDRSAARRGAPALPRTVSVHVIEACSGGRKTRVRAVTTPVEPWGLGGGVVSTGAPAAAAVRLLARGPDRGARRAPSRALRRSGRPVPRARAPRTRRFEVETTGARASRMKVGVPTEIKPDEYRVALTPAGARELTEHGHEVLVQAGAGDGQRDRRRRLRGAGRADRARRRGRVRRGRHGAEGQGAPAGGGRAAAPGQMLFTYLHLAADRELTRACASRARSASPTRPSRTRTGKLPLLAPMSEIAGKLATQAGAFMLEKPFGGRGILLGGVPGVAAATVMIIGGGVVGMNAAFIAIGMEADVFVFDKSIDRLRGLDIALGGRCSTVYSSTLCDRGDAAARGPRDRRGARARRARAAHVKRDQLKLMKRGRGARGRLDRPGRLLRDLPPDDAQRPDLRGRRRAALLRREHARRRADHLDLRAHERDPALRARARRPRRARARSRATPGCASASTSRAARHPPRRREQPRPAAGCRSTKRSALPQLARA